MSVSRRFAASLLAVALSAGLAGAAPRPMTPAPPAAVAPANPDVALRAHLAAQRKLQIQRLLAYKAAGKFPVNASVPGMAHFFVDPNTGALCAMANLLVQSGRRDLVEAQAKRDNGIALATLTSGPIYDWMLDSGLTQEEVNFIQELAVYVPHHGERLGGPTVEQENARIDAHLKLVVAELRRDTAGSLAIAVAREQAHLAVLAAGAKKAGA